MIRHRKQRSKHRPLIFWGEGSYCLPWLVQTVSRGTHILLPAVGLGVRDSFNCLKSWNWTKLTTIYHPNLLLEVASLNRLWSSKMVTSDRFCQCNYCLGQETGSWYFLLHLLRIFLQATGFCTWKKPCVISIGGQNKQDRKLYVQYTHVYIKQLQQKLNTEKNGKKINQMCKCSSHLW